MFSATKPYYIHAGEVSWKRRGLSTRVVLIITQDNYVNPTHHHPLLLLCTHFELVRVLHEQELAQGVQARRHEVGRSRGCSSHRAAWLGGGEEVEADHVLRA